MIRGKFWSCVVVCLRLIVVEEFEAIILIIRIDRKDVESESLAVAPWDGTAPKTMGLAIGIGFNSPLDAVAFVFLAAVDAVHQNWRGRRPEGIVFWIKRIVVVHEASPKRQ